MTPSHPSDADFAAAYSRAWTSEPTHLLEFFAPDGSYTDVAETIAALWETAARDQGLDSDFTAVIKPFEKTAGITVGPVPPRA